MTTKDINDPPSCLDYDPNHKSTLTLDEAVQKFLNDLYAISENENAGKLEGIQLIQETFMQIMYPPQTSVAAVLLNSGGHPGANLKFIDEVYRLIDLTKLNGSEHYALVCATWQVSDKDERMPHRAQVVQRCHDILANTQDEKMDPVERAARVYKNMW